MKRNMIETPPTPTPCAISPHSYSLMLKSNFKPFLFVFQPKQWS